MLLFPARAAHLKPDQLDCEPHRWRRRRKIAHINIEGGAGGGRRAGMTVLWGSAHHGKRTPKTRDLTVVRRQQWPRKDASVAAASPQKLTHDRSHIGLDVWKVAEATEQFETNSTPHCSAAQLSI